MTMASAKNRHSVAVLTAPLQYAEFIAGLKKSGGRTSLEQRFRLATHAMKSIGEYRSAIGTYFSKLDFDRDVKPYLDVR